MLESNQVFCDTRSEEVLIIVIAIKLWGCIHWAYKMHSHMARSVCFCARLSCTEAICCHRDSHTSKHRVSAGYSCSITELVGQAKNNTLTFKHLFMHMNTTCRCQGSLRSMPWMWFIAKPEYDVLRYLVWGGLKRCQSGPRMGQESSRGLFSKWKGFCLLGAWMYWISWQFADLIFIFLWAHMGILL